MARGASPSCSSALRAELREPQIVGMLHLRLAGEVGRLLKILRSRRARRCGAPSARGCWAPPRAPWCTSPPRPCSRPTCSWNCPSVLATRGSSSTISCERGDRVVHVPRDDVGLREREAALHRPRVFVDDARERLDGFVALARARVEAAERVLKIEIRQARAGLSVTRSRCAIACRTKSAACAACPRAASSDFAAYNRPSTRCASEFASSRASASFATFSASSAHRRA